MVNLEMVSEQHLDFWWWAICLEGSLLFFTMTVVTFDYDLQKSLPILIFFPPSASRLEFSRKLHSWGMRWTTYKICNVWVLASTLFHRGRMLRSVSYETWSQQGRPKTWGEQWISMPLICLTCILHSRNEPWNKRCWWHRSHETRDFHCWVQVLVLNSNLGGLSWRPIIYLEHQPVWPVRH